MSKKLITNSMANVAILGIKFGVGFIMTPIIVKSLGNYDYGIWEIAVSVIGYMGLLQLGIPPAIVRYVARYKALGDRENLNRLFSTAFVILLAIGSACFLVLLIWALVAPQILSSRAADSQRYAFFLVIIAVQVMTIFCGYLFQSIHEGYQRYFFTNAITAVNTLVGAAVLYYLFKQGYGLIALALGNTIGLIVKFTIYRLWLYPSRFGAFRFAFSYVDFKLLKELLSFGIKSFVLGIAGRVSHNTDTIVIGAVLGPAVVVFYAIPSNLLQQAKSVIASITLGFMPHFSELIARDENGRSKSDFLIYSRYVAALAVCLFLAIFFLGPPFIGRWIGVEYSLKGKTILYLLGAASLLQLLNPFHGRILTSMGHHGALAKVRLIEAVLNIGLSLILVRYWGKEGVALGTLVPALLAEPVVLYLVGVRADFSPWHYVRKVLVPLLAPTVATASLYAFIGLLITLNSYGSIIFTGTIASLWFLFLFFLLAVRSEERKFFHLKLGRFLW